MTEPRSKPFIVLISEVEQTCRSILLGEEADIPFAVYKAEVALAEAKKLALSVSLEALDALVEPRFKPGDVIANNERRYTVLDPAWSPMGKLRIQAEGQAVKMTWWKRPSDLPPAYRYENLDRTDQPA